MGLEIDIDVYLHNLMATKPPYQCPFDDCRKTYKTHQGISYHLTNQHGHKDASAAATGETESRKKGRPSSLTAGSVGENSSGKKDLPGFLAREALTYTEAQRMIVVEIDGLTHKININEPISIVKSDKAKGQVNGIHVEGSASDAMQMNSDETPKDVPSIHPSASTEPSTSTGKGKKGSKSTTHKGRKSHGHKTLRDSSKGKLALALPSTNKFSLENSPEKPKLPEPSFRVVDEPIEIPDAPKRESTAYYRFIEKSPEELDESVEYDMDEQDVEWLKIVNTKRREEGLVEISPETFELLIDRFEKESYFQAQSSPSQTTPIIDEDAVCVICMDGDCQNSNVILFCDMCNLPVHQECYGVPYIPEGQWLCRRCLHSPSTAVDCVLCPNKGGAFKQTDKREWAHVVCALWIPEVCFANAVFLEPIDSIERIDKQRWKLLCYICKQRGVGACIQCHRHNCYTAFHVTCAQTAGLYMNIDVPEDGRYAGVHVRKAAYCHIHTPADETGTALSGVYSTSDHSDGDSRSGKTNKKSKQTGKAPKQSPLSEVDFKDRIKKTRKILAEKRTAVPQVSIPTIPLDRLNAIADKANFRKGDKRNEFILRLLGYWTLKRQARNGVPLLRRLQISHHGNRHRRDSCTANGTVDSDLIKKLKDEQKYLLRLRQDLEKARLLVELIRKREKTKRQFLEACQAVTEYRLQPFRIFLHEVLKLMVQKDNLHVFTQPVDVAEVHDYLDFIETPMDFSTMEKKISSHLYQSFADFESDFDLIVENCKSYNENNTYYVKLANKLKENCQPILQEAKARIDEIGFDESAGVHDPPVNVDLAPPKFQHRLKSFEDIPSPIVGSGSAESLSKEKDLKAKLAELEKELTKAKQLKSGGSRSSKIKKIDGEIKETKKLLHAKNPRLYAAPSPPMKESPSKTPDDEDQPVSSPNNKNRNSNQRKKRSLSPVKSPSSPFLKKKKFKSIENVEHEESSGSETDIYGSPTKATPVKNVQQGKRKATEVGSKKRSPPSSKTQTGKIQSNNVSSPKKVARKTQGIDSSDKSPSNKSKGSLKKTPSKAVAIPRKRGMTNQEGLSSQNTPKRRRRESGHLSLSQVDDRFKVYRSKNHSSDESESSSSSSSIEETRESDEDEKEDASDVEDRPRASSPASDEVELTNVSLRHLDVVWSKIKLKPWFPAIVVDLEAISGKSPRKKDLLKPSSIPSKGKADQLLVQMMDGKVNSKNTWHWVSRKFLRPLAIDDDLDKKFKKAGRTASIRKEVRKAYEKVILFQMKVKGDETFDSDIMEGSSSD